MILLALTASTQHHTRHAKQGSKARLRLRQTGMEEVKSSEFIEDMIIYVESPEESN